MKKKDALAEDGPLSSPVSSQTLSSHPDRLRSPWSERMARASATIAAVCVVGIIIGGFSLLFANYHAGKTTSGSSLSHATTPSILPDDSGAWFRSQQLAISGSTLYASNELHYIYALNANTGTEIQHYHLDNAGWSPLLVGNVLYIISEQGTNNYIEAWRINGSTLNKLWSYTMICCSRESLVYTDGALYTFAGGPIGSIVAVRASDGKLLWNYPTNGPSLISLSAANGIIYAGTRDNSRSSIFALRAGDGHRLWGYTTYGSVMEPPALVNGVLYAGTLNRSVYALRASDGSLLWQYTVDYGTMGSPAVANGVVYIGTGDNSVYALQADNGRLLWHRRMDDLLHPMPRVPNSNLGVLVGPVADGNVYIGSDDGYLAALSTSNGSLRWFYQTDGLTITPALASNGVVYVYSQDGYTNKSAIYNLSASNGTPLWRSPIDLLETSLPTSPPTGSGGITPHLKGVPSFTAADVVQYFKEHPVLTTSGKPGTITKILFITSKQASVLMKGESTGLPDDRLVCYVELKGPFLLNISVPRGAKIPVVQNIQEVFDAETGQLLVFGSMG